MEYFRFMPIPFDDVAYVVHNASNLTQPEVPWHLFLSPPNGIYASITNDSPTYTFKIQRGKTHECLFFKGVLQPIDDAHLTSNGQQLALIHIVDCAQLRDIVDKEFQVELNVTLRLFSNAVPLLVYDITPVDLYTILSSVYLGSTSIDRLDIKIKINEHTTNNGSDRNQVIKYVIATPGSQQDVPPSIDITPSSAGDIQQGSASDFVGVGNGKVHDSDCRTALGVRSFRQVLTGDASAPPRNSARNGGCAVASTAHRGLCGNGDDTAGIGTALLTNFARNIGICRFSACSIIFFSPVSLVFGSRCPGRVRSSSSHPRYYN
jgi:hypothetical protein